MIKQLIKKSIERFDEASAGKFLIKPNGSMRTCEEWLKEYRDFLESELKQAIKEALAQIPCEEIPWDNNRQTSGNRVYGYNQHAREVKEVIDNILSD
jgi:hypothetical protein